MHKAKKERRRVLRRSSLAASSVLLSTIILAGCSSLDDFPNPVGWLSDSLFGSSDSASSDTENPPDNSDFPKIPNDKRPDVSSTKARTALSNGLAADHANAQYTQDVLRREGNPTRPLSADLAFAPKTEPAAPASTSSSAPAAAIAAVPEKPVVAVDEAPPPPPRLTSGGVVPAAAPVPAPAQVASAATAPARVASVAPAAAMTAPATTVEEVYRRRLAEFNSGRVAAVAPTPVSAAVPVSMTTAPVAAAGGYNYRTVLIPPSEYHRNLVHDNGGARPLEAFEASRSAASFQVAAVRFGEGTAELPAGEQQNLKDILELYRSNGGTIRIFGHSASPRLEIDASTNQMANRQLAAARAAAIARALVKLGIPARKIFAGAAPDLAQASTGETTEIYIDY